MHECFANHDIRVFRDTYISSTSESLNCCNSKKNKNKIKNILKTITEEQNKAYFVTFWNLEGFTLSRCFYHRCHHQSALLLAHIHDLYHILKTIILNNFKINILITGCLFTTSTIKWQWHLYFSAYSNCSAVSHSNQFNFCWWYSFVLWLR